MCVGEFGMRPTIPVSFRSINWLLQALIVRAEDCKLLLNNQSHHPFIFIQLYKHEEMVPPQPSTNSLSLWDDGGISGTTAVRLVL